MRFWLLFICFLILQACAEQSETIAYNQEPFVARTLQGGHITDGLDVSKIEYQNHHSFERYIFHITHWEGVGKEFAGTAANSVGHYELTAISSQSLHLFLSGFRTLSAALPIAEKQTLTTISRLRGEQYEDDSTIALLFNTDYQDSCQRITEEANTSRLIIDIKPCK